MVLRHARGEGWGQTTAYNSWLCLMSNWHYNGCPPAGILFALPRSAQLCCEWVHWTCCCDQVQRVQLEFSCIVSPFALICLEPETMQPFCPAISWTWRTPLESVGGEPLWFYEVIAIIVVHTQKTLINTIVVHLVWRRRCFTPGLCPLFSSLLTLKINAIYCCPFAKKEKGKARKKREKKTGRQVANCTIAMHVL